MTGLFFTLLHCVPIGDLDKRLAQEIAPQTCIGTNSRVTDRRPKIVTIHSIVKMEPRPTAFVPKAIRVIVIGAGYDSLRPLSIEHSLSCRRISGIQFLKDVTTRLSNVDITVYDKNEEEGGTWAENRYPG